MKNILVIYSLLFATMYKILLQSYLCASLLRRNTPRFNYPLKAEEFITAKFIIANAMKFLIAKTRGEGQNPSEAEVQCSQQN